VSYAKNGRIDRDAVWDFDPSGPKERCTTWGPRASVGRDNFGGFVVLGNDSEFSPQAADQCFKWQMVSVHVVDQRSEWPAASDSLMR